jgi:hypothetical protein
MDETGTNDGLRYIGHGTTIIGVPARNLTAAEVTEHGRMRLLSTRLYEEYPQEQIKKVYTPKPRSSALKGKEAETKE